MKTLSPGFRAHLDGGETTLCWCWRVSRRDGVSMGFTDHDRNLEFEGTVFEAAAGFSASEINESVGLGVDNLEVSGALSSDRLTENDLAAGFYDDALVEVFRVDWSAPDNRVLMRTGSLGEVSRSGTVFKAEVRGLAHYLQQPRGRLYQFTCDADLGDGRCGVVLASAALQANGTVVEYRSDRRFEAEGLETFENDFFTRGLVTFTSGPAQGQRIEVKTHTLHQGRAVIECWSPVRRPLDVGATFFVHAGCDKTFQTCANKFSNRENFRGFPHLPGNDFVASHATRPGTRR